MYFLFCTKSLSLRQWVNHARSTLYHPKRFSHYISQRWLWKDFSLEAEMPRLGPRFDKKTSAREGGNCCLTFYLGSSRQKSAGMTLWERRQKVLGPLKLSFLPKLWWSFSYLGSVCGSGEQWRNAVWLPLPLSVSMQDAGKIWMFGIQFKKLSWSE